MQGALIVGSDLRREMPLLAHRLRKAAVKRRASVAFLNPRTFDYMFPVAAYSVAVDMIGELGALVRAAAEAAGKPVPASVPPAAVSDAHRALIACPVAGHPSRRDS